MTLRTVLLLPLLACGTPADGEDRSSTGTCIDDAWSETLPDTSVSLPAGFSQATAIEWLYTALDVRYPLGRELIEGGREGAFGDCLDIFLQARDTQSSANMLQAASTLVHECGHGLDLELGGFTDAAYVLSSDLTLTCSGGSMNDTPARSLIQLDAYAGLKTDDSYARIYLDGDPADAAFDSGDQGLDMLMEEAVQYVNSLATDYAFSDQARSGSQISARDGILTFLWYVERYLRMLRVDHPATYDVVMADPCWRELILSVWGRAWLYLDATEGITALGIDDAELEALVLDPDLLDEIDRVRQAEGC